MITCVAVVGKNNRPLFIQTFNTSQDPLKFHFIAHAALDIIDEKLKDSVYQRL
jgi:hypothetical protein